MRTGPGGQNTLYERVSSRFFRRTRAGCGLGLEAVTPPSKRFLIAPAANKQRRPRAPASASAREQ